MTAGAILVLPRGVLACGVTGGLRGHRQGRGRLARGGGGKHHGHDRQRAAAQGVTHSS